MIDALLLRERLASALESSLARLPLSPPSARCWGVERVRKTSSRHCSTSGGSGSRAWLRTIARAAARTPKPDLVWSGPEGPGLHARDTRRVYEELLGCAERSIWASTYVFFDGPKAFEVLARRMESRPALRVTLLLNIQRQRSDTTASEQLVCRFADRFWKTDWPVFYRHMCGIISGKHQGLHCGPTAKSAKESVEQIEQFFHRARFPQRRAIEPHGFGVWKRVQNVLDPQRQGFGAMSRTCADRPSAAAGGCMAGYVATAYSEVVRGGGPVG